MSDATGALLVAGLCMLFFGGFYLVGRRIPSNDPGEPGISRLQRYARFRKRSGDRLAKPMVVLGLTLLVAAGVVAVFNR